MLRFDRADYLTQTFNSLTSTPGVKYYSIYISQDGNNGGVTQAINNFKQTSKELHVVHLTHTGNQHQTKGVKTVFIARHYGWGNCFF